MNEQQRPNTEKQRYRFWRKTRLVRGLAIIGTVAGVATGTWAVEESGKLEKLGLQGLFSNTVPDDLSEDEFAKLDGNWAAWSKGAAAAVADFYSKLGSEDAAGQRAALNVLKSKLDVMQRSIDDPRYVSLIQPLTLLHGRLSERVAIAEAALDTLEIDGSKIRDKRLGDLAKDVNASITALRAEMNSRSPNGLLWLPYVKADLVEKALAKSGSDESTIATVRLAQERIAGRSKLTDEKQRDFLGHQAFLNYEAALEKYLAGVEWKPPTLNLAELRAQLKALLEAMDSYEDSRSSEDAAKIRTAFTAVSKLALDGGDRISAMVQKYALNYNVRILASEEFLNRLLSDAHTEKGPVVDNVMGVPVSGNQSTVTNVGIKLLPSGRTARFDLMLTGTIVSNTVATTTEATVYTQGNHHFTAMKEVNFDGEHFVTAPATISVQPHNTTTGISTNVGGLFQGIANSVASREVEARRGAGEAHAAMRVRENVLPKFNSEVDKNFAEAGPRLQSELFNGLRATGLYPDAYIYQTTDKTLRLNSRLMAANEVGANLPRVVVAPDRGATLLMHETAVNNAINRMELAGQTLTEPQLRAKLEAFFSKALNHEVKLPAPKETAPADGDKKDDDDDDKGPSAIIFAGTDPMRVSFDKGELTLIIRAGFKQEGKDDIPTREITVPLTFDVKGNQISITRGSIVVVAADGEGGGIAINGVVRKKIQSALPEREIDSKLDIKGPKHTVVTHITSIKLVDGWVVVAVK